MGREFPGLPFATDATFGRAELMHDGADTFFGHQEIMGTRPAKPFGEPICNKIELIKKTLEDAGYHVRYYTGTSGKRLLIVNEACTVADNVECDPGQAFNVTAAIDDLDFEEELKIGHLVRSVSVVPRVITFGGRGVHLQNLLDAIEEHGDYIGVNAPASGVYNNDYHCIHMGYGVDPEVQIPTILGKSGLPVFLLGKVADVVTNNYGTSIPMVDTASVLQRTLEIVKEQETAFICIHQPDGFKNLPAGDFCCRRLFVLPGLGCCRGQVLGVEVRFDLLCQFQPGLVLRVGVGVHQDSGGRMTSVSLNRLEVTIRLQELIGGTGMPQTVKHDLLKLRVH